MRQLQPVSHPASGGIHVPTFGHPVLNCLEDGIFWLLNICYRFFAAEFRRHSARSGALIFQKLRRSKTAGIEFHSQSKAALDHHGPASFGIVNSEHSARQVRYYIFC